MNRENKIKILKQFIKDLEYHSKARKQDKSVVSVCAMYMTSCESTELANAIKTILKEINTLKIQL